MKPLRQEDYQAMAEENQRLKREIEGLRRPRWKLRIAHVIGASKILGAAALCVGLVFAVVAGITWLSTDPPGYRKTPCYFIAHTQAAPEPWNPWFVWKSECSKCANVRVVAKEDAELRYYQEFKTENDAWKFIQDWHLEACK